MSGKLSILEAVSEFMLRTIKATASFALAASLAAAVAACAASGEVERLQSLGMKATGLRPVYPTEVSCPEIDSFFADTTLNTGKLRPFDSFMGYHEGVDISVAEGTEVLAMTRGRVIAKVQTPNGSWALYVQHLSMDTGMKELTYSQYGHIQKDTPVKITDWVQRGQVIAYSGSTGTYYPHLHVTTFASPSDWFNILEKHGGQYLTFEKGRWIDPLLFLSGTLNIDEIPDKKVKIHYQSEKSDAKVRWPLRCKGELN